MEDKPASARRRRGGVPRSEDELAELAVAYLGRFPCTEARLRRYLQGKLDDRDADRAPSSEWVDAVVARMKRARLLDDEAWARSRARILLARGRPRRVIERDLWRRGVPEELARRVPDEQGEALASPELSAACNYARRRRLGPWATEATRRDRRRKHLASLARAGFSFSVARRIVDAVDVAELEAALEGPGKPAER